MNPIGICSQSTRILFVPTIVQVIAGCRLLISFYIGRLFYCKVQFCGMKKYLFVVFLATFASPSFSQEAFTDDQGYEYFELPDGDTTILMKKYFFVSLNSGPTKSQTKEEAAKIQQAHLAHIAWMGKQGYVDLAGPVESEDEFRGILVFNVPTIEKVQELVAMDPAVKAGRLVMKVYPWWCAKGAQLK